MPGRRSLLLAGALIPGAYLVAQTVLFEPVQPELFGAGGTFTNAWADYDNDGDLDLFVGFDGAPNRLYRNDAGSFRDVAREAGLADARPTRAAAWGDFDLDGDADLLVGFAPGAGSVLRLYRNERAKFSDATDDAGLSVPAGAVRQPAWIDVDGDGDLDLFVAFRDRANAVFRHDGTRFTDVAAEIGLADTRKSVGAVWFDFDEDGDLDVAVGNMDGDANGLYRNDSGRFTDVAPETGTGGLDWGGRTPRDPANGSVRPCAADVNNDGHVDLFFANYGKNGLFLNRGQGKFESAAVEWGVAIDGRYDTCVFADIDHDGDTDLYVNGTVTGGVSYPDYLFRNTGSRFEEITPDYLRALHADHGAQWADFDGDGDVDLALTGSQKTGMHALFRNALAPSQPSTFLKLDVVDADRRHNLAGVTVRVYVAGTKRLLTSGSVDGGSGYNAQNAMPVHLAVPRDARVDIVTATVRGNTKASGMETRSVKDVGGRVVQIVVPTTGPGRGRP